MLECVRVEITYHRAVREMLKGRLVDKALDLLLRQVEQRQRVVDAQFVQTDHDLVLGVRRSCVIHVVHVIRAGRRYGISQPKGIFQPRFMHGQFLPPHGHHQFFSPTTDLFCQASTAFCHSIPKAAPFGDHLHPFHHSLGVAEAW